MTLTAYLAQSAAVLKATGEVISQELLDAVVDAIAAALSHGKPLLVCGNGGSAADAMHITGELVGCFLEDRQPFKVYCLGDNASVVTAWSNDRGFDTVFSRQVEAYGEPGAVLIGLSTSGNSKNVIAAFQQAHRMQIATVAFTGEDGGHLAEFADYLLAVPSRSTPLIQQAHLCLYHYLCLKLEQRMIGKSPPGSPAL